MGLHQVLGYAAENAAFTLSEMGRTLGRGVT